ncbi:MAG: hypothetical protein HYY17_04745 [Planctomycetes bacterium]|nr:hypothetical protein [Planctomycetota bacterium]
MAKLVKCPRCQEQIDASHAPEGSTVRCVGCSSLVRVPSGAYPKVTPPPAAAVPKPSKSTPLFRKMSGAHSPGRSSRPTSSSAAAVPRARGAAVSTRSNLPLFIGAVVGLGVVIVGAALFLGVLKRREEPQKKTEPKAVQRPREERQTEPEKKPEEKSRTDNTKLRKTDQGFKAPAAFEPGAEAHARAEAESAKMTWRDVTVDAATQSACDDLLRKGDVESIKKEDWKYLPAIIVRFLSDEETVAKSAFRAMSEICVKRNISGAVKSGDPFKNPINVDLVNSKVYRGGDYLQWAEWWNVKQNQEVVADWKGGGKVEYARLDPETADWDKLLSDLKDGGLDDETTPAGRAVRIIDRMGRKGLEKLVNLLDRVELPEARIIVSALNHLTKQNKPLPNAATKGQAKSEWEYWLKNH